MTTSASSASAIGAARMPTQGSWRPLVMTSVLLPCTSIDSRGLMMSAVMLFGIYVGTAVYFEAALIIAMLGFVGTVVLSKYVLRRDIVE